MAIGPELLTGALAGIAFVGCSLANARPANAAQGQSQRGTTQPGRRREVVVNGKRVKTVDIHAHTIVPEAAAVINHPLEAPGLLWSNLADRIAEMDAEGIDVEALSINPYWYRADRDASAELIRIQNEKLAEFCAATPDRFVAFATVALQHPQLAVEQLEHAVKKLGLRGLSIGGSVAGRGAGRPEIPSGLGQGRGARDPDFHAPERHQATRAERPPERQRPADQHDWQPARNYDRPVASDLRGDARPLSGLEDLRRAWRRLSAVLRQSLGRGDHHLPEPRRRRCRRKSRPSI